MSDDNDTSPSEPNEGQNDTKWSPAGFEVPEPERENGTVVCAGCGDTDPVSEMGMIADEQTETEDGAVAIVNRYYLHNDEDCMMAFMGAGSE